MRILLIVHHQLDPNLGAPGATIALGEALKKAGGSVQLFGFDTAFPEKRENAAWTSLHTMQFPWRVARYLQAHAADFDVIDATTADAWLWHRRGRPGARGPADPVLVTRSHGLEHLVDRRLREEAKAGKMTLSWKYPLYYGGFHLWEVTQSLRAAQGCILLNAFDREFAIQQLRLPAERIHIVPMGIADYFFPAEPDALTAPADGVIRLAYLATWQPRKGSRFVVDTATALRREGVPFRLTLFGTGVEPETVRADFPEEVRPHVEIVARYRHAELPSLLRGQTILLFPSLAEGFSRALIEAMACGIAPVATAVGGAPQVIEDGVNGRLIPPGDGDALREAVRGLIAQPAALPLLRERARESVARYRWENIARQTLDVYRGLGAPGKPA